MRFATSGSISTRSSRSLTWRLALPLTALALLAPTPAQTREVAANNGARGDDARVQRMSRIERARLRGQADELERLSRSLETRSRAGHGADTYDLAYALYRLHAITMQSPDRTPLQKGAILRAQTLLEERIEADPTDVESLVLLSSVLGLRADAGFLTRMRLGRRAHASLDRALELSPDHPRALVQRGILLFHTPAAFGGGPDRAIPILERARTRLAAPDGDESWPSWGGFDAAIWLGQSLAAGGRSHEARAVYLEALEQEPELRWIRDDLLPALEPH